MCLFGSQLDLILLDECGVRTFDLHADHLPLSDINHISEGVFT